MKIMADSANGPTLTPSAALTYSYEQLDPAHRTIADNIARQLRLIVTIDSLPEAQKRSVLTKLKNGEVKSALSDLYSYVEAGIGAVKTGAETAVGMGVDQAQKTGMTAVFTASELGAIINGADASIGLLQGAIPALANNVSDYLDGKQKQLLSMFGYNDAFTEEQARAIATAAASAYQSKAVERGAPSWEGFKADWDVYSGAAIGFITQFVSWAVNHTLGNGTATIRSFNDILAEQFRTQDAAYVQAEMIKAGEIAGKKMTPEVVAVATQPNIEKTRDPDQPEPPTEKSDFEASLDALTQGFATYPMLTSVGAGAVGLGAYKIARPVYNTAVTASVTTARIVDAAVAGFTSGVVDGSASIASGLTRLALPTTQSLFSAVARADEKAERAAVKAANREIRQTGLAGDMATSLMDDAVRTSRAEAYARQLKAQETLKGKLASHLRPVGDTIQTFLGNVRALSDKIDGTASQWDKALHSQGLSLRVRSESEEFKAMVRGLAASKVDEAAKAAAGVTEALVEAPFATGGARIVFKGSKGLGKLVPVAGVVFAGYSLLLSPNEALAKEYAGEALSPWDMAKKDLASGRITQGEFDAIRAVQFGYLGTGVLGALGSAVTEGAQAISYDLKDNKYARYLPPSIFNDARALQTKIHEDLPREVDAAYPKALNSLIEAKQALVAADNTKTGISEQVRVDMQNYVGTAFGGDVIRVDDKGQVYIHTSNPKDREILEAKLKQVREEAEGNYGQTLAQAETAKLAATKAFETALSDVLADPKANITLQRVTGIIPKAETETLHKAALAEATAKGDVTQMPAALQEIVARTRELDAFDKQQQALGDTNYAMSLTGISERRRMLDETWVRVAQQPEVLAYLDGVVATQLVAKAQGLVNELTSTTTLPVTNPQLAAAVAARDVKSFGVTGGDTVPSALAPDMTAYGVVPTPHNSQLRAQ